MNFSYKWLAVALGVVVALLVGGKMYIDHAEQVALEKEVKAFAAEVGRSPPDPEEVRPDLHIAAGLNLPVLTMSLLKQGADVHARDRNAATQGGEGGCFCDMAAALLKGAPMSMPKTTMALLHRAAEKDASAAAAALLKGGADVHAKDEFGCTPLHWAVAKGASATAEVLLKGGADVHAKDIDGRYAAALCDALGCFCDG